MKQIALLFTIAGLVMSTNSYGQSTETVSSNYSPLHWAAAQGYIEMIRVLVDKGYNINAQDIDGFTPLHYAAASGSFQGVEFLIDKGADIYLVNSKNITPLTLAAQAGEQKIVDYLFIKMRSSRIEQLKDQSEKERVNTDLVLAAKSRAEAERLRQQASEWTKEAEYWRTEAEKWTREANTLKEKQVQVDQMARERYDEILGEKLATEENYKTERLARNAAERLLREQGANTTAQIRAYEAQVAALAAQRATDAAIDNLAEEFLKQGIADPKRYERTPIPADATNGDPNVIPMNILDTEKKPTTGNFSIELDSIPPSVSLVPSLEPVITEWPYKVEETVEGEYAEGEYAEEYAEEEYATEEYAEEGATEELATEELATEEVATEEYATEEVATEEYATEEYATEEVAAEEYATEEVATEEYATEEYAEEEYAEE